MTVLAIQSEALTCWSCEVYCPICGEWIPVEIFDDDNRIFYHVDDVPHTEEDYKALEYGIN